MTSPIYAMGIISLVLAAVSMILFSFGDAQPPMLVEMIQIFLLTCLACILLSKPWEDEEVSEHPWDGCPCPNCRED